MSYGTGRTEPPPEPPPFIIDTPPPRSRRRYKKRRRQPNKLILIVLPVFAIFLLLVVASALIQASKSPAEKFLDEARVHARMAVLERLKHPDDAEFVEVVAKYSDNNPDIVLVGGRVRAVNSFRAHSQLPFLVRISRSKRTILSVQLEE